MTDEPVCSQRRPDVNARTHKNVQIVDTKIVQLHGDPHSIEVVYECLNCGKKLKLRLMPV